MHPLCGSWTANLAKSRRHANHQFQDATLRIEIHDDVDGVEHPIPQAPGVVSLCRWVGTMMTATVRGIDAQGASFEQVIVFDRRAEPTMLTRQIDDGYVDTWREKQC